MGAVLMDESIEEIKAEAAALEGNPAGPGAPSPQPAGAAFDIAGPVAMGVAIMCGFIAKRAGPHWAASQQEAQAIGEAVEKYANYKWPGMKMTPGLELLTVVGAFAGPRMIATAMQPKKQAPAPQQSQGQQQQPGRQSDTAPIKPTAAPASSRG